MKVPCADITRFIKEDLTRQVTQLKKKEVTPKLVAVLIGDDEEQLAAVKIKQKTARELGIEFELIHLQTPPAFLQFANLLKDKSHDPSVHGVVIEQPLPSSLQSDTIYNFIPLVKELEGHRKKTTFMPSIGLAILSILKYIYKSTKVNADLYPDAAKDPSFFKQGMKQKKVVLIGRGPQSGVPIAKTLSLFRINFINVNSQTFEPEQYYRDADVIVTAVGKRILKASDIKPGAALIDAGAHGKSSDSSTGDYEESEIKSVAGFYTPTSKCMGPLESLFLFKNLLDAVKLQV